MQALISFGLVDDANSIIKTYHYSVGQLDPDFKTTKAMTMMLMKMIRSFAVDLISWSD
jgi:hypothetical protein